MRVVVVAGGDPPAPGVAAQLPVADLVVAADSGLDHALALGLTVDLVIGDLDSASAEGLAVAVAAGARVERHAADKDATDVELAVAAAVAAGARSLTVVTGAGDRLDHLLGALAALAAPSLAAVVVEAWIGTARVSVVHGPGQRTIAGRPGEYVSLVPLGGLAGGVRSDGLRWALHGEDLAATATRGISNELLGTTAVVALESGVVAVIRPYALAP